MVQLRAELAGEVEPRDSIRRPGAGRIVFALMCAAGSGFGSYYASHPPTWASGLPAWLFVGGAIVAGGLVGVILHQVALRSLRAAVATLQWIDAKVRRRVSGVIGFSLLFVGFVLQFAGTLLGNLTATSR